MNSKKDNILLVCISAKWGERERAVINDLHALKGNNVYVMGVKNSPLFEKLKPYENLFEPIVLNFIPRSNFLNWGNLKRVFKDLDRFSNVHCYDIDYIWCLCFFLRKSPQLPLSLYLNKELFKSYKKVWYRPLSTRIDGVIVSSENLIENVWSHIRIHPRKCSVISCQQWVESESQNRKKTKGNFEIGIYLSPLVRDTSRIDVCINLLRHLNSSNEEFPEFSVQLFMDDDIGTSLISDNLVEYLKSKGVEDRFSVVKFNGTRPDLFSVDLWLELANDGDTPFFAFEALGQGKNVVAPRSSAFCDLLFEFPRVGESYKRGDLRELIQKILLVVREHSKYKQSLTRNKTAIGAVLKEGDYNLKVKNFFKGIKKRRSLYISRNV